MHGRRGMVYVQYTVNCVQYDSSGMVPVYPVLNTVNTYTRYSICTVVYSAKVSDIYIYCILYCTGSN